MNSDYEFYRLRKAGKIYFSKVFSFPKNPERLRRVYFVTEDSDSVEFGEIEDSLCLRMSKRGKIQVTALISQDSRGIRRLTIQSFENRKDEIRSIEGSEFTFREEEFKRLKYFLDTLNFIDLSNEDKFQVGDLSSKDGPKAIIDVSDKRILSELSSLSSDDREALFKNLSGTLSASDINLLTGRKQGLEDFEAHHAENDWSEKDWQDYFGKNSWVFGYGLDYRISKNFDREMSLGSSGTDNKHKPTVDFLSYFNDYTVLVEIKKPDTPIFKPARGGRAGTWDFSSEFIGAVSQILEQRAEWQIASDQGNHFNRSGTEKLHARTRSPKTILIIGSSKEFENENIRSSEVMRDTFELFRRESRTIEILTFDELLERARFIARDSTA